MLLTQRINNLSKLGISLKKKLSKISLEPDFLQLIKRAEINNPWFTENNILYSFKAIADMLVHDKLITWIEKYSLAEKNDNPQRVGVIMAGNIPMVGFHDMLSVLISGNIFVGKQSSKDNILLKYIAEELFEIDSEFEDKIFFEENNLKNIDAIIATGGNNSSRYFEYYFSKYPHIIRKNRNSIAVLSGNETKEDFKELAKDIFTYFGLGCRNVSKLYVPENYNFNLFFESIEDYDFVLQHTKYTNNYDYNKTIYLMNNVKHLDNNFALLTESSNISSPISVLYFEYYTDINTILNFVKDNEENLQCVVSGISELTNSISFGNTQNPELLDYADNVDTISFLSKLN